MSFNLTVTGSYISRREASVCGEWSLENQGVKKGDHSRVCCNITGPKTRVIPGKMGKQKAREHILKLSQYDLLVN